MLVGGLFLWSGSGHGGGVHERFLASDGRLPGSRHVRRRGGRASGGCRL